ncbi:MAG: hypothetical protein MZV70_56750 [Desulfobacterales bacterium]|nr:hypothetical protein [Desulfobacterales bacterium]
MQESVAKDTKTTEQKDVPVCFTPPAAYQFGWTRAATLSTRILTKRQPTKIATQIVSDLAMTGIWAEVKSTERKAGKPIFLQRLQPFLTLGPWLLRARRLDFQPCPNPGPANGKFQGRNPGIWSLTQSGDTVISTSDSDFKLEAKVYGAMIRANGLPREGIDRDFQATIAEDGLSFNGAADYTALRDYFTAKKIE